MWGKWPLQKKKSRSTINQIRNLMEHQLDGTMGGCLCKNKSTTQKSTKISKVRGLSNVQSIYYPTDAIKISSSSTGKTALGSCTWTWKFLQTCVLFSNEETCLKICTALKPVLLVPKFQSWWDSVLSSIAWWGPRRGQWTIAFACWEHQYDSSHRLPDVLSLFVSFPRFALGFWPASWVTARVLLSARDTDS